MSDSNLFEQIDLDGSGGFDRQELRKYFAAQNFTEKEGEEANPLEGYWERLDTDRDGIISWQEFDGPKGAEPASHPRAVAKDALKDEV